MKYKMTVDGGRYVVLPVDGVDTLVAERDALEAQVKALGQHSCAMEVERNQWAGKHDALAAHVNRWHDVYVDLTNNMITLDGVAHYVADNAMMRRFDELDESAPATSLARQKLLWQAEVLDQVGENAHAHIRNWLKAEAADRRRQAEGEGFKAEALEQGRMEEEHEEDARIREYEQQKGKSDET